MEIRAKVWRILEITKHLFWAEHGGIVGMWKTLHAIREGKIESNYESVHQNMPIEQIIDLTWQTKEIVPTVAAPWLGGPLAFWIISLNPDFAIEKNEAILSSLNKISTAKQLDFINLND